MTADPIYCPAQTYPQTRDLPRELCENEVEDYGDFCPQHDADDRADDDHDRFKESRYED